MKFKNKQKTILVRADHPSTNKDVNGYLDKGWAVKQIAPLGGHESGSAIILLEKEEEENKKPLGFGGK